MTIYKNLSFYEALTKSAFHDETVAALMELFNRVVILEAIQAALPKEDA